MAVFGPDHFIGPHGKRADQQRVTAVSVGAVFCVVQVSKKRSFLGRCGMKAVCIAKTGGPEVMRLKNMPLPEPDAGEVRVRLSYAGVNFIDVYIRNGYYERPLPLTLGMEGAGIVDAVGDGVIEFKPGDRVAYAGHPGSYAEYSLVKVQELIPLPEDISLQEGAAFPLQGMTAHYLTHDFYRIRKGDTVLVHAAAGGVGLQTVQWLKHMGARVIATVSTTEKAKVASMAGADDVILYTKEDFVAETLDITDGNGADYIIDGVGKTTFMGDLEAVKVRGHVCLFGAASGAADPLGPYALMPKSITVSGGSLFNFIRTREELLHRAHDVIDGMREGWLNIRIEHAFMLKEAAHAHRLLQSRGTTGKLLLKTGV